MSMSLSTFIGQHQLCSNLVQYYSNMILFHLHAHILVHHYNSSDRYLSWLYHHSLHNTILRSHVEPPPPRPKYLIRCKCPLGYPTTSRYEINCSVSTTLCAQYGSKYLQNSSSMHCKKCIQAQINNTTNNSSMCIQYLHKHLLRQGNSSDSSRRDSKSNSYSLSQTMLSQ